MLQSHQLPKVSIFRDYGELIRLVTRQSVQEFADMLGVSTNMIYGFESCRTYSQKLLERYNAVIEEYNIEPIYNSICASRQSCDLHKKWGDD